MHDRDDQIQDGWNQDDETLSSNTGKDDHSGSNGAENFSVSNDSDDAAYDDGEGDLCPDYTSDE